MTEAEWDYLAVQLQARWPSKPIPEESIDLYFADLSEFEAEQVEAAITALYRDGREWAPNGAQIRNKLLELRTGNIDHGTAYRMALEAAGPRGGFMGDGLKWLREQSPMAADAVERYGWRDFCFEDAPDTTRRAQFRDIFVQAAEQATKADRYQGIEAPGLEGLPRKAGGEGGFLSLVPGQEEAA